jgi:predicted transcriptional regulator of viral defense system
MSSGVSKDEVLRLAGRKILQSKELEARGVSRMQLRRLVAEGVLERTQRGLYIAKDFPVDAYISLAEVALRSPKAVIGLLSALRFYELTTENPSDVYIMLPVGTKRPRMTNPRLDVSWSKPEMLVSGIEEHIICGVNVRITSPARTVVDCFKYRSKVGLNVAVEALHDAWRKKKATADDLWNQAALCRMRNVMRPYFESLTA